MIVIYDNDCIEYELSDCDVPPNKKGTPGQLYLNSSSVWCRFNGGEWKKANYNRSLHQVKKFLENKTNLKQAFKELTK